MHIGRKTQRRKDGSEAVYVLLRSTYRDGGGTHRERVLYLGAELAEDLEERAAKKLRKVGYTPAQIRAICAAVVARRDRNEHVPIVVRGKPDAWKDPLA